MGLGFMLMLEKIKIRTGLTAVLGLFFIALLASTLLASWDAKKSHDGVRRLHLVSVEQVDPLYQAHGLLLRANLALTTSFRAVQDGLFDQSVGSRQRAAEFVKEANAHILSYLAVPKSDEGVRRAKDVEDTYQAFVQTVDAQINALAAQNLSEYDKASLGASQSIAAFERAMRLYFERTTAVSTDELEQAEQRYSTSLLMTGALVGLALVLLAICANFVVRGVVRPLNEVTALFDRIATGDLTIHVASRSTNEIGLLMAALGRMRDSLMRTIGQVRQAAIEVDMGSGEIASGNTDLSARTEQQAASLQETAASMEELYSTVRQNADSAQQADQLAEQSRAVAQRGGETVDLVVQTMNEISSSSEKVAEIVSVIDSIAFQTNILALNAAVEAARAGEQGKGFAVVASEVRTLAQRSAQAAREIKQLIDESLEKVSAGSTQAKEAGVTMAEVVASVGRVTDIMGEINAASEEQVSGIHQVNVAVSQMDTVTQQNAALVEQAAAATTALNEQAHRLVEAVAVFKISPEGRSLIELDE